MRALWTRQASRTLHSEPTVGERWSDKDINTILFIFWRYNAPRRFGILFKCDFNMRNYRIFVIHPMYIIHSRFTRVYFMHTYAILFVCFYLYISHYVLILYYVCVQPKLTIFRATYFAPSLPGRYVRRRWRIAGSSRASLSLPSYVPPQTSPPKGFSFRCHLT